MVASILEYESPFASIRITRARRASSDRILRLRTRRSSSVRSSVVNVSAIWRQRVPVLLQAVQATRCRHRGPTLHVARHEARQRYLLRRSLAAGPARGWYPHLTFGEGKKKTTPYVPDKLPIRAPGS